MRLALNFQTIDPSKGGAETYVVDLCRQLVRLGHQVEVYANSWVPGVLPTEVRIVPVPANGWTRWGRIVAFGRNSEAALKRAEGAYDCTIGFINTWHHDVLIPQGGVHQASREFNAWRFPEGWRRRCYQLSKQLPPKAWAYAAIERKQYDPARNARVVAVSELVRGHLERYQGVPRERTRVIYNAIDTTRLDVPDPEATRRAFRAELGLPESERVALFLAHNFWLKGLPALLKALRMRRERHPDARPITLLVCGGGKLGPFRRMVDRLDLAGSVRLLGFQGDIRPCFWGSDVFVLPTYYDPCSLVVFEALSCGLPVITTACNGAGELITNGREGFVIPHPDDTTALVEALNCLGVDQARTAMSKHARQLGRSQSFENHVARLVALCEEVADEKRAARNGLSAKAGMMGTRIKSFRHDRVSR